MSMLTEEQARERLQERLDLAGGKQTALAKELGVSLPYLNDVLHSRRELAGKLLDALGLERVISYREKPDA